MRAGSEPGRGPLDEPFRPRLARRVALGLATLVLVLTPLFAVSLPGPRGWGDVVGFAAIGLAIVAFCWRQANVSLQADEGGVTVTNLVVVRRLAWAEIISVRFGGGRPWVQLDLANGDTLAVMGIQRADGDYAAGEARRLATLVELFSRTPRDD